MKKTFLFFLLAALIFCIAGCNKGERFDKPIEKNCAPKITLIINDSKRDTTNENLVFGKHSEREDFVYVHYYIEGSAREYDLRIRVETRTGENDHQINEEYTTVFDVIKTKKSGKWNFEEIYVVSSGRYFYRVTLYNSKTEEILASKTFYTPKEETVYSEVSQNIPKYRTIELTEEEREFYELCSYAVFNYAKANEYSKINDIKGYFSPDGKKLYLEVVFRAPWSEYFEINITDPTDYLISYEPFNVEGFEKALSDYYYVKEEIKKNF